MVKYPNLFKARYRLKGRDWVRSLPREDLAVFVDIGNQANDHGRAGGLAVKAKHPEHLKRIARIGATMSNIRQWWSRRVKEETERELGITMDY